MHNGDRLGSTGATGASALAQADAPEGVDLGAILGAKPEKKTLIGHLIAAIEERSATEPPIPESPPPPHESNGWATVAKTPPSFLQEASKSILLLIGLVVMMGGWLGVIYMCHHKEVQSATVQSALQGSPVPPTGDAARGVDNPAPANFGMPQGDSPSAYTAPASTGDSTTSDSPSAYGQPPANPPSSVPVSPSYGAPGQVAQQAMAPAAYPPMVQPSYAGMPQQMTPAVMPAQQYAAAQPAMQAYGYGAPQASQSFGQVNQAGQLQIFRPPHPPRFRVFVSR